MENASVRKFKLSDAKNYLWFCENYASIPFAELTKLKNINEAKRLIRGIIGNYEVDYETKSYCVALESTDKMIGCINVYALGYTAVELGIWVWTDYQKQGIGLSAMNQIKNMIPGKHIICNVLNTNNASIALINKLGYIKAYKSSWYTTYDLTQLV